MNKLQHNVRIITMRTFITSFLLAFLCLNIEAQVILTPCAQLTDIHVVVIGSSTAAGTGPSTSDSVWGNRYRSYLQAINPQNRVTNLAIGGTTTYHIMSSWFVASASKPATNPTNHVTEVINLGADAIIVNTPSNDASNGFGLAEQMSNFIAISNAADSFGIPVWICTTQPRNFGSVALKAMQTNVRDSVLSYFGNFVIDFWTGLADGNDDILLQYNSGDGVHLNDAGYALLVQRIINEEIPNLSADTATTTDHAVVSMPSLDLGTDTLLYQNQSLLLQDTSFSTYSWSNNSTINQLLVDSSNSNLGSNLFWLSASGQYG